MAYLVVIIIGWRVASLIVMYLLNGGSVSWRSILYCGWHQRRHHTIPYVAVCILTQRWRNNLAALFALSRHQRIGVTPTNMYQQCNNYQWLSSMA